jgi:molecular chaperone GrpE
MRPSDEESTGPVVHDRRRIDPLTGEVRPQAGTTAQRGPGGRGTGPAGSAARQGGSRPGGQRGPGQQGPGQHGSGQQGPAGSGEAPASAEAAGGAAGGDAETAGGREQSDRAAALLAERTADLQRLQAEYANYRKRVERDRMLVREQALANVLSELLPVLDDIGRAREHGELTGGFKSVADSLESVMIKLGLVTYGEDGDPFDPNLHEALMHSYSPDVTGPTCVRVLQPGYQVGSRIIRPARVAVAEPAGTDEDEAFAGPGAADTPAEDGSEPGEAEPRSQ